MQNISVVVPTFNRGALIADTLRSILAQSSPADEVIVVDDGSTDDTADVVGRFGDAVRYLRIPNSGVQVARNTGIDAARHDRVALCDSDDLWEPDHLARQRALIAAAPDLEFTFSNFRIFRGGDGGDVEPVAKFDRAPEGWWTGIVERRLPEGWLLRDSFVGASFVFFPIFPSATMLTKSLFDRAGRYDAGQRGNSVEDGEFTTRCLFRARAGAVPDATVRIRKHAGNVSGDKVRVLADEVAALEHILRSFPEARPYRPIIAEQIVRRSIQGCHAAFAAGDYALLRRMIRNVPLRRRAPRLHAKHLIATLPDPVARRLGRAAESPAERRTA
ncbi:MAG TPA: glycosyltransferase family 2 protein [Stellaceae bacterium]|jgi:glycosyltransferase involved in cell wall biosynthesis